MRNCVPAGWAETTLGEIRVDHSKSIDPRKEPDQTFELYSIPSHAEGRPEVVKGKEVGSAKKTLVPGAVVVSKINPRINRTWVVGSHTPHPKIGSGEWIPFFPVQGIVPEYLAYYMRQNNFRDYLATRVSGVGGSLMRIKPSTLSDYPFVFPSEAHQHRIVEAIESYLTRLDDAVASLERVQRNLERYRASVLKAAVEGRLVPTEAELARREGRDLPAPRPGTFYVYDIECEGGSHYIGQTDDIPRRWREHIEGKGASWTKRHRPIRLVHWEKYASREEAVEREKHLKTGFGRKWLKREIAAGRTRQAGYEPASRLLKRILAERKTRWIEDAVEKARAKGITDAGALLQARKNAEKKYKEPEAPDLSGLQLQAGPSASNKAQAGTTDLPNLPEGWCWATVDQLAWNVVDCLHSTPHFVSNGHACLDTNSMNQDGVVFEKLRFVDTKTFQDRNRRMEPQQGDVVFAREGTVGTAVCLQASPEVCLGQRVMIIRPNRGISGEYLAQALMSEVIRSQYRGSIAGSTVAHINMADIKRFLITVPPTAEQLRIVEGLARITSTIRSSFKTASRGGRMSIRLRQSILKWAFEGKLVEQDPNDEPAAVLLERIKAERDGAKTGKPSRGRKRGRAG